MRIIRFHIHTSTHIIISITSTLSFTSMPLCVRLGVYYDILTSYCRIQDKLGEEELQEQFKNLLKIPPPAVGSEMDYRLKLLREIPFKAILTTNFDTLIPGSLSYFDYEAVDKCHKILRDSPLNFGQQLVTRSEENVPVLQIHGSIDGHRVKDNDDGWGDASVSDQVHLVCTRKGYRKLLHGHASYSNFLRGVMSNYTILYLGVSFEDHYLNELRGSVLNMLDYDEHKKRPLAFAITNDKTKIEQSFYYKYEGVKFLNYNTMDEGGVREMQSELDKCMKEMCDAKNQEEWQRLRNRRDEIEKAIETLRFGTDNDCDEEPMLENLLRTYSTHTGSFLLDISITIFVLLNFNFCHIQNRSMWALRRYLNTFVMKPHQN